MRKVLITGATGFIGGFLVHESTNRSLNTYAAIRKSSDLSQLNKSDINLIDWDFNDINGMADTLKSFEFDYIIHNAGLTKSADPKAYWTVNTTYLDNVLQAISLSGIQLKKFIFISSLAAYGPADNQDDGLVSESSVPHPVTNYGRSKLDAETLLKTKKLLPWVIIRPTAVYGPREKDLLTVFQTINSGLELTAGFGKQKLTFIYVKDLVSVIFDALQSEISQKAYFVTDGLTYEGSYFNNTIAKHLQRKTLKIKLPIIMVKTVAFLSEKISAISGIYPALNIEKVNEIKARSWACDIDPLKTDFKFAPRYTLDLGIKETVAWYKSNGWIK